MFTINNYTDHDLPRTWLDKDEVTYLVWQPEIGEQGTPHLQGYVHLSVKKTLIWLKANLDAEAHWERRRGSHEQARDYCMKEATRAPGTSPTELGAPPAPGKKPARAEMMARMLDLDMNFNTVAMEDPVTYGNGERAIRAVRELALASSQPRWREVTTTVYWGATGTGKSRLAAYRAGDRYYRTHAPTQGTWWFDDYDGEDVLIIEDYNADQRRVCQLLKLLDGYSIRLQRKCGHVYPRWTSIYITSNDDPATWAFYDRAAQGPLARRINKSFEFVDPVVWNEDGTPVDCEGL